MSNYFSIEEAATYLGVSSETIKRYIEKGEIPVYKLERALRVKSEDLDALLNMQVILTTGLRAVVKHSAAVSQGSDTWRVIVSFEDTTKERKLVVPFGKNYQFTDYTVWVTAEYLEDHARLPAAIKGAEKFALRHVQEEFEKTKDTNGDRNITRIEYNSVVASYGMLRHNAHINSPIVYKEYSIRFTTEGFADMAPNVFGEAVVFYVNCEKAAKESYFAFAQSHLNEFTGDTESASAMIKKALNIIKAKIDNNALEDKKAYTYEYKFHQFTEKQNPGWWTKVLAPGYRF